MTAPDKKDVPKVVEAWDFDGTEESVRPALRKYPELKFVWRGGGGSFVSWKVGRKLVPLHSGKYIVRMSDGTFSRRSELTLQRAGLLPHLPALLEGRQYGERSVDGSTKREGTRLPLVKAWIFDGTPTSVQGALDAHPELHFIKHPQGDYLLWDIGVFRCRVMNGQCLAELSNGKLAQRQIRVARKAGLVD